MAITGKQTINIGQPNESVGSDSLYNAFTKTKVNFDTLFACSSPFNTFTSSTGINIVSDSGSGTVTVTNTGVTSIIAGTGVVINQSTGAVTISATGGGGGGGTLSSVGLNPASVSRLVVTGSPLVTDGNMSIDLATSGVTAGTYNNPNVTIDSYGRITSASNGATSGTVTSVGLTAGSGIQVSGGPITTAGSIIVTNTGVTRINPGSGISVSGGNGNVTISALTLGGTVTSVGVTSSSLDVSNSPILNSGNIVINLKANTSVSGNLTAGNLISTGKLLLNGSENLANGAACNLQVVATYFETSGTETCTLAAGAEGQLKTFMMKDASGGSMTITVTNAAWGGFGTMTFTANGQACTLQYVSANWYCIGNNGVVFA